jgi:hypothetical protein
MAAMNGIVQSSPRPAISRISTAWPAPTASVSVDQPFHRLRLCLAASRAATAAKYFLRFAAISAASAAGSPLAQAERAAGRELHRAREALGGDLAPERLDHGLRAAGGARRRPLGLLLVAGVEVEAERLHHGLPARHVFRFCGATSRR